MLTPFIVNALINLSQISTMHEYIANISLYSISIISGLVLMNNNINK